MSCSALFRNLAPDLTPEERDWLLALVAEQILDRLTWTSMD
jgi:hypothetical protein